MVHSFDGGAYVFGVFFFGQQNGFADVRDDHMAFRAEEDGTLAGQFVADAFLNFGGGALVAVVPRDVHRFIGGVFCAGYT